MMTMTEKFTCPRRAENFMSAPDSPFVGSGEGLDTWQKGRAGLVGQPRGCSYCGSMHPVDFLIAVHQGCQIGPTDKGYKLYVEGMTAEDPDKLWILSSSNRPSDGLRGWKELTRKERKAVKEQTGLDDYKNWYYSFRTMATVGGKFYTQHLSPEQGFEFFNLHKEGKVNWGYPGHPYVPMYLPGPSTQQKEANDG